MDTIITAKNKTRLRAGFIAIFCICIAITIAGCGKNPLDITTESTVTTENTTTEDSIRRMEVVYNGKKYVYNDHLTNIVIMGVDNETIPDTVVGTTSAGQADSIYLVSYDRVTGNANAISIPRDTIATVDVFDRDGNSLGPSTLQICLSYAFGDGKHESCRNTKEAVSRLFYRLPIQNYCSLTLDAMQEIAGLCGTISVKLPNDSLINVDSNLKAGTVFEVNTENAQTFFRYRDTNASHSALERSKRHESYLSALEEQYLSQLYAQPEKIADVYTSLEPFMITNMGSDDFVQLMEALTDINTWVIPGEPRTTDKYDEFYIDEDSLYEQIITCFFEEVTGE